MKFGAGPLRMPSTGLEKGAGTLWAPVAGFCGLSEEADHKLPMPPRPPRPPAPEGVGKRGYPRGRMLTLVGVAHPRALPPSLSAQTFVFCSMARIDSATVLAGPALGLLVPEAGACAGLWGMEAERLGVTARGRRDGGGPPTARGTTLIDNC